MNPRRREILTRGLELREAAIRVSLFVGAVPFFQYTRFLQLLLQFPDLPERRHCKDEAE